jgi:hypothetical protein
MAQTLGFLSFDIEHDEALRALFIEEAALPTSPCSIEHWSLTRQKPKDNWEKLIQGHISRCDFFVVLIGTSTGACEEVAKEILMAKQANVPFFGVRAAGLDSSVGLPPGLPLNRTIPWDWAQIASAVRQLQAEGKHSVFV